MLALKIAVIGGLSYVSDSTGQFLSVTSSFTGGSKLSDGLYARQSVTLLICSQSKLLGCHLSGLTLGAKKTACSPLPLATSKTVPRDGNQPFNAGYSHMDIISGAGHDACYVSRVAPTGMIFVPCENGISHNEEEEATPEDLAAGCNVLLHAIVERANIV